MSDNKCTESERNFFRKETSPSKDCFFVYITSQIQHHNDKVNESFKYFLQITTLLFGGLGWHIADGKKN